MNFKIENPGAFFKNIRLERKITLKQASELSDLSTSYISRIENGSSNITKQILEKFCTLYSLDITEFIDDTSVDSTSKHIDLSTYILNNDVYFKENKILLNDKLALIGFLDFLTSTENYTLKKSCLDIINSAKKIAEVENEAVKGVNKIEE